MIIRTKTYGDDFEIRKIEMQENLFLTVEVFKVAEGYKSFAHDNTVHHYNLEGYGVHGEKEKSVNLAVHDLEEIIREYEDHA